jgi:hypothetical protein
VDRKFGLIDDVKLYGRAEYERVKASSGAARPRGWFKWGDAIFQSFVAGFIKTLDLDIYHSLQGNIARKMFRWFDKEWHHKQRVRIDLHRLAEEKLGAKRGQPRSELLRLLRPGFEELTARGLIGSIKLTELARGRAEIEIVKPLGLRRGSTAADLTIEQLRLAEALAKRGVKRNGKTGPEDIVRDCDAQRIRRVLEVFDFLTTTNTRKSPGWIVSACRAEEEFSAPKGFLSSDDKTREHERRKDAATAWAKNEAAEFSARARERREAKERVQFVDEQLTRLSTDAQVVLERDALDAAPADLRRSYLAAKKLGDGVFFQKARIEVLYAFFTLLSGVGV